MIYHPLLIVFSAAFLNAGPILSDGHYQEGHRFFPLDGSADERFGEVVALSGNTAVVGVPWDSDRGTDSGSAYVYMRGQTGWRLQQKILAYDGHAGQGFGSAVSLDGNLLAVGTGARFPACYQPPCSAEGSVYIYSYSEASNSWEVHGKLRSSMPQTIGYFGFSVAVSGDRVLVGAGQELGEAGVLDGAAYVFRLDHGGTWTLEQRLVSPNGSSGQFTNGHFGLDVALQGDTAVVSEPTFCQYDPQVHVFKRIQGAWQPKSVLLPTGTYSCNFGWAIAIDGGRVVVGDFNLQGAVYIYEELDDGSWILAQKLVTPSPMGEHRFGWAVSLFGDRLAVGAPFLNVGGGNRSGAAFIFDRTSHGWEETQLLSHTNSVPDELFGYQVSLWGSDLLVGAPKVDAIGTNSGVVVPFQCTQ